MRDLPEQGIGALDGAADRVAVVAGHRKSNDRVNYFHSEQGHVLDVVYSKRGQTLRFEPRPDLTTSSSQSSARTSTPPSPRMLASRFAVACCSACPQ